ncbi:MAG: hypothetical protein PVJ57_01125 [Phycisphaerae bacterium]
MNASVVAAATEPAGVAHSVAGTTCAVAGTVRPTAGAGDRARSVARPAVEDAAAPPDVLLTALAHELRPHGELDLHTLTYHLEQSDATAAHGFWHAAVNEARSFLEGLVAGVAQAVERRTPGKSRVRVRNGSPVFVAFSTDREFLLASGFTDGDENAVLLCAYSVASAKGSHAGVTDEAWARLVRAVVFAAGEYVVSRYAAWKRDGPPVPAAPPKPTFWRRWWGKT